MGRYRLNKGFGARVRKITRTITDADLTAAATTQVLAIGTVPANAAILGVRVGLATPFTGGGATASSVDIGTTGDADALIDGSNLFAAAVDGEASTRPLGIAPNKRYAAATVINATVISDVDVNLLTAGSTTIEVFFGVADTAGI